MFKKLEGIAGDLLWAMLTVATCLALFFALSYALQSWGPNFIKSPVATAQSYVDGSAYGVGHAAAPAQVTTTTNSGLPNVTPLWHQAQF